MSADIRELRNQCHTCVECSPLQKPEPLQPHEPASYPFQAIHMDLCSYMKKQYLVIADLHCCHDTWNHRNDNGKLLEAVLLLQNTPRKPTDLSSAELMFGHQICDRIPTPHHLYLPQYKTAIEKKLQEAKHAPATNPTSIAATWNKGVHPGQPY